ncbi:phosphatidic acid phosphatase type 2/haloperoxidase [Syncephalis plumigaleata]|nr:phosphatidic acid phosphatase type 2/haloperoxidase [Syncephalis plumigaleata]
MSSSQHPSYQGQESEPLLSSNRRRGGGGALEEGRGNSSCDDFMDDHPVVTAVYSRAGLLDLFLVLILALVGSHAYKKAPFHRDVVDYGNPAYSYPYHEHVRYPDWPWLPIIGLVAPVTVLLGLRLLSIIFYSIMAIPAVERWCPRLTRYTSGYHTPRLQQTGIKVLVVETAKWMYIDGFAILATMSLAYAVVETLKTSVGGLRPDFLSRCQWDPVDGKCTGDERLVERGRKAFPSGHAAYSFASMTLLACVLFYKSLHLRRSFFKTFLCLLPIVWAVQISITRWQENRHGAMDIMAGAALGTFIAVIGFLSFYRCRNCSHD